MGMLLCEVENKTLYIRVSLTKLNLESVKFQAVGTPKIIWQ
jgi:hypothetical protein